MRRLLGTVGTGYERIFENGQRFDVSRILETRKAPVVASQAVPETNYALNHAHGHAPLSLMPLTLVLP